MKKILLMFISSLLFSSCSKDDSNIEIEPPTNMGASIRMVTGSTTFTVSLYDNTTADAFLAMLPMTINMREMNGNEKYYDLPGSLPTASARPDMIHSGDIMLYGSRTVVLFYETFPTPYSYTPIGHIDNTTGLKAALGSGSVTIKFELQ